MDGRTDRQQDQQMQSKTGKFAICGGKTNKNNKKVPVFYFILLICLFSIFNLIKPINCVCKNVIKALKFT